MTEAIVGGTRSLVACFGNVLRSDDGFGPAVAAHLTDEGVPDHTRVLDVGIGGLEMVHDLAEPCDLLIVVDAVDVGRQAGSIFVIDPDIADLMQQPLWVRREELSNAHYTVPDRALRFALAIGVLPERTWLVGCQPSDADELGMELSPAVARAVPIAAAEVRRLIAEHCAAAAGAA